MSEEMAVSDNATAEDVPMENAVATVEVAVEALEAPLEEPSEAPVEPVEAPPEITDEVPDNQPNESSSVQEPPADLPEQDAEGTPQLETQLDIIKMEPDDNLTEEKIIDMDIKHELGDPPAEFPPDIKEIKKDIKEEIEDGVDYVDDKRGIKRRASDAFSDDGDVEFLGFESIKQDDVAEEYTQVVERLEAEVSAASLAYTPVRYVMATPLRPVRANKRLRKDTDGSRPSSAQSSRSEDDNPSASPAQRGRRPTTEMSSPLLRVPLERGWKRELVYRAALDAYSRRNADIYYYTPLGKKLRSTREVAENLSGTGLTLDNFSFFKEPLGLEDPDKEIIRDAKVMRRVESPISSPAPLDGKRAHKPKPPKGASPEPAAIKSPPAKIKVKSLGSRLSGTPAKEKQKKPSPTPTTPTPTTPATTTPATDNNNTSAWKKPRAPEAAPQGPSGLEETFAPVAPAASMAPIVAPVAQSAPSFAPVASTAPVFAPVAPVATVDPPAPIAPIPIKLKPEAPKPKVQTRAVTPPATPKAPESSPDLQSPRRVVQPCSLACGNGVPSLSCAACLCMYHPHCAGHTNKGLPFLCKNCRKSSSPPPVAHKPPATTTPAPRRRLAKPNNEHRVTLRMKVSGGSDGSRVWAVAAPRPTAARPAGAPPACPPPARPPGPPPATLPQSLAIINGKRFIVVPRPAPLPTTNHSEISTRARVSNGVTSSSAAVTSSSPAVTSRRRGRPRADDQDHFTAFYNRARSDDNKLVIQIFQYLGMRDLAHCARVSRLWRALAATPALWRHVRMKNSHVSDWGGLCAALKRHGTKWLDLRKMLLPQNDTLFWEQFTQHIATVDTLERLELCRCPASAVESAAKRLHNLQALSALAIRDSSLDPASLGAPAQLRELRLKSLAGLALSADLTALARLQHLQHLSLTSIKELGWRACDVIGSLSNLESLELGECTFRAEFAGVLSRLTRLKRLRLERGTAHCAAPAILRALASLPHLTALELVNVDVKVGFDDALAECKNIQRLLIIPTYVSQSATTNKQVLSGVLRLKDTLSHLMWGVTIELLRVTELFIDQCSAGGAARRELGECIPVLKPVPGCRLPMDHHLVAGPPQVEILPLPTLQRLLSSQLPNTKLKLLRIPFHATWRQSLADFQ